MSDIFISYSHRDSERFVHAFAKRLMHYGFQVWWDTVSIRAGSNWEAEIKAGIKACKYFLIVASPDSAQSDYVAKEIRWAIAAEKTIIPIILDGMDITKMPGNINKYQGVKFSTGSDGLDAAFSELLKYLKDINRRQGIKGQESLPDLFRNGQSVTFGDLEKDWLASKAYGNSSNSPVALLLGDTPFRASAHIVAPRTAQIIPPETIQVFLHFTGDLNSYIFDEYLKYIALDEMPLWTVYVQGPYIRDRGKEEFRLVEYGTSEEVERQWSEAAKFVLNMVVAARYTSRHIAFFLYSPNPLPMIIGADRSFNLPYSIYHHRSDEREVSKQYVRVFSTETV